MRLHAARLATLSLVAVLAAAPASAHGGGGRPFADDFDDATTGGWTFSNRAGRIADGRLWIDGGYLPDSIDRDGWALTHVGDTRWRDYSYSFTYSSENVGGTPPDRHMATAYVRVAAASANVRRTMYRIDVWAAGDPYEGGGTCTDASHGFVTLGKYVNGVGTFLAEGCSSNAAPGINRLRISVRGGTLMVQSNGRPVLRYVDADPIPSGGVGMGQIWETNGWFDDVRAVQHGARTG